MKRQTTHRGLLAWTLTRMRQAERKAAACRKEAQVWDDVARQLRAVADALRE